MQTQEIAQDRKVFDEKSAHRLMEDVELAVRASYGNAANNEWFNDRTAIKALLTAPCREAGHQNYEDWCARYTAVTYCLGSNTMLVLVDEEGSTFDHGPDKARFISALALELTMFFSTLVAPAQRSVEVHHITAPSGRKFAVFKFLLLDEPSSLNIHGDTSDESMDDGPYSALIRRVDRCVGTIGHLEQGNGFHAQALMYAAFLSDLQNQRLDPDPQTLKDIMGCIEEFCSLVETDLGLMTE